MTIYTKGERKRNDKMPKLPHPLPLPPLQSLPVPFLTLWEMRKHLAENALESKIRALSLFPSLSTLQHITFYKNRSDSSMVESKARLYFYC